MANNEVKITFTGDATQLFSVADRVERRIRSVSGAAMGGSGAGSFAAQQAEVKRITSDINRFLVQEEQRRASAFTSLNRSASSIKLAEDAKVRRSSKLTADAQIADINRVANASRRTSGGATGGPSAGEMRYGRINLARQGADVFTQLGSGQGIGITAVQQGPQIIEAMAMSGGQLAAAMTATKAAVIAMAPVMAAGAVAIGLTYKITGDIRKEAERRLKTEEAIAAATNRQYLAIEKAKKEYEELVKAQTAGFVREDRQATLATLTNERLRERKALLAELIRLNPTSADAGAMTNEILDINSQLRANDRTAGASRTQHWADQLRAAQRRDLAAAAEAAKRRADDIKKAQEQANELGETWRDVFRSLSIQQGSDNPFVKVFFDADDAITKLKASIKGLPLEMQAAALASQRAFNATQLFGEQVNSAFRAFDLRETAARFRDGDGSERRNLRQTSLDRYIADFERTRSSRNVRANEEYIARIRRSIGQDGNLTAQERLDRQLSIIGGFSPRNGQEQSILDRRVLGIASGLNPADLRNDQRDAIAAAAERQAEVEARSQMEGLKAQQASAAFLQNISAYVDDLKQTATKGGTAALNSALNITVRDETQDGVRTERIGEGTQADVAANYGLFGGGSGGLTSF